MAFSCSLLMYVTTEKIIPGFYEYDLKQMMEHMEKFITVIKIIFIENVDIFCKW